MMDLLTSGIVLPFISGAVSAYAVLRYRMYLSERSSQVNDHLKDLEKLLDAALSVVSVDGEVTKDKLMKLSLHHSVASRIYPQVMEICHDRGHEYQSLMLRLFELVTAERNDDLIAEITEKSDIMELRAQEIIVTGGELTTLLREVRKTSLSIAVLISDLFVYARRKWAWFHNTFLTA